MLIFFLFALILALNLFVGLWEEAKLNFSKVVDKHWGWSIVLAIFIFIVVIFNWVIPFKYIQVVNFLAISLFCIFLWTIYPSSKSKKRIVKSEQINPTLSADSTAQTPKRAQSSSLDVSNDPRIIHLRDSLAKKKAEAASLMALAKAAHDSLEKEKMVKKEATKLLGALCGPNGQIKDAKIALKKIAQERATLSIVNPCDFDELRYSNSVPSSYKSSIRKKRENKKRPKDISTQTRRVSNSGCLPLRLKQRSRYIPPPDRVRSRWSG